MHYVFQYEACSLLFVGIIALHFLSKYSFPSIQNKFFTFFLMATILDISFDLISVYTIANGANIPVYINYFVNIVLFCCNSFLLPMLMVYILAMAKHLVRKNYIFIILGLIPAFVAEIVIITTPFTHYILYFTQDGSYEKGKYYPWLFALGFAYFLVSFILTLALKKKISITQFYALTLSMVLIFAATVVQIIFPEYLLMGTSASIFIFIIYITLQNPAKIMDNMSGIFNRTAFLSLINQEINFHKKFNLIYIAIDRTRTINSTFGVESGNKIIKQFAEFLKKETNNSLAFRLQGDQFVLMCRDEESCKINLYKIIDKLKTPFLLNNVKVSVTACICYTQNLQSFSSDGSQILLSLEQMMGLAKDKGRGTILCVNDDLQKDLMRKKQIETALEYSINEDKLEVYLQPIYSVQQKRIVGAEALVRMYTTSLGIICPSEFIPMAEKTGLIIQLGEQVQRKVAEFIDNNRLKLRDDIEFIEVNLSAIEFIQPNLSVKIKDLFEKYRIKNSFLIYEITESVATNGYGYISEIMNELSGEGISFALDDFGTGFSNLTSIMQLPFSTVKFDRTMLLDSLKNKENEFLLRNMILMFHELGKKVIVEGVENAEQLKFITDMQADYIQGYYFGKPMQMPQFADLIAKKPVV